MIKMFSSEMEAMKMVLKQMTRSVNDVKQESKKREDEMRLECEKLKKMQIEDEDRINVSEINI